MGAALRSPQGRPFSNWTSPALSAPSCRASAPALSILVALSWTHSSWLMPFMWHFAFQRWLLFDFHPASVHVLSHYMLSADQELPQQRSSQGFQRQMIWHWIKPLKNFIWNIFYFLKRNNLANKTKWISEQIFFFFFPLTFFSTEKTLKCVGNTFSPLLCLIHNI